MRRFVLSAVLALSLITPSPTVRAADWEAPKDGKLTEKQVTNYAAAQKEMLQLVKAMGKAMEGGKSGVGAAVVLAGMDDKINAILARHDMKRPEYDWLQERVAEGFGIASMDEVMEKGKDDLAEQKKKNAQDVAVAQRRVTEYEQASKAGTRVLTPEQRADRVREAKENQASALEEAKGREQEVKDADAEAKQHDVEAAEAEKLAKNPPADISADDRPDYVKGRQEEAANAKTAAKESRDKLKEAQRLVDEAKAKAAGYAKQTKNPEVPATDEEKAQVKQENEQGLASAKSEVETLTQAAGFLKDAEGSYQKQMAEIHKGANADNVALVRKHMKEIQEAWGMAEEKKGS